MSTEKNMKPETQKNPEPTQTIDFTNCGVNVILKPKVISKAAFVYRSINDLKQLIEFVKSEPKPKFNEGKLTLTYSKIDLFDNCVVLLSEVGKVSEIITLSAAADRFEIKASK
jgi:hypothetical protein